MHAQVGIDASVQARMGPLRKAGATTADSQKWLSHGMRNVLARTLWLSVGIAGTAKIHHREVSCNGVEVVVPRLLVAEGFYWV